MPKLEHEVNQSQLLFKTVPYLYTWDQNKNILIIFLWFSKKTKFQNCLYIKPCQGKFFKKSFTAGERQSNNSHLFYQFKSNVCSFYYTTGLFLQKAFAESCFFCCVVYFRQALIIQCRLASNSCLKLLSTRITNRLIPLYST